MLVDILSTEYIGGETMLCKTNQQKGESSPSRHSERRQRESGSPQFPALYRTFVPPGILRKARKCLIASLTIQYFVKHSTNNLGTVAGHPSLLQKNTYYKKNESWQTRNKNISIDFQKSNIDTAYSIPLRIISSSNSDYSTREVLTHKFLHQAEHVCSLPPSSRVVLPHPVPCRQ